MTAGPIIIPEFNKTMDEVKGIIERNYWNRYHKPRKSPKPADLF